jgi:hypothetical protein
MNLHIREELLGVMGRGLGAGIDDAEFDRLARSVFAYQYEHNPLYRAFCQRRGVGPASKVNWLDIPAVPTDAFKAAPLVSGRTGAAAVVFRTSGTTSGASRRGAHYLASTDLYRAALREGFRSALLPDRDRMCIHSLILPFDAAPDSSLSFMIADVMEVFGADGSAYFVDGSGVRWESLIDEWRGLEARGEAILVVGTSFAFVHLLDTLAERKVELRLPSGSRIMDTGGYKGRSREVSRSDLYAALEAMLGVPVPYIVNEYGMTEMSSQLYDGQAGLATRGVMQRRHEGPGWTRTVAVDPETLEPLPAGELGILRHVDLANLYSVASLQTSDLGRVTDEGVELLGRVTAAEPRGCSIAMDELMKVMDQTQRAGR